MQRRQFLAASLATSAAAMSRGEQRSVPNIHASFISCAGTLLQVGPQQKLTETYLSNALIPALARLGMGPVGAFRLDFGPETPTYYVLIPGLGSSPRSPKSTCSWRTTTNF